MSQIAVTLEINMDSDLEALDRTIKQNQNNIDLCKNKKSRHQNRAHDIQALL